MPGGATFDGSTWTVLSSGSGIGGASDQFHFVSQTFTGAGTIAAKIVSQSSTDPLAQAGVMVRTSAVPKSASAAMVVTPGGSAEFEWRDQNGSSGDSETKGLTAPIEVKIVRAGNVFTGFYSADGVDWTEVGSRTLSIGTSALAGLAATAHNNSIEVAEITDVSFAEPPILSSVTMNGPSVGNQPIPSVEVTFSLPVDPLTLPGSVSLTRNGQPVAIPPGTLTVTPVVSATKSYIISGLAGLTGIEGAYTLTVDATQVLDVNDVAPGETSGSASWLVDTTPPTSTVSALASQQKQVSFAVTVTGTDPDGSNQTMASGILSFTIYVSTNSGSWSMWTTVPATSTSANSATATATFTGTSGTTYAFYSVATDAAGNTQPYAPQVEASTTIPDLTPPVTAITGGTNNGNGTFTLNLAGIDSGGGTLNYFEVWVAIDGHKPISIGPAIPAGTPSKTGAYSAAIRYVIPPAEYGARAHTYTFSVAGIDSSGNIETAHTTPNRGKFAVAYSAPSAAKLAIAGLTIERGAAERSYVRYVDVAFNNSSSATLAAIVSSVNRSTKTNPAELTLMRYNLNGTGKPVTVSLKGLLSVVNNEIEINFGAPGVGGAPGTTAADGYYALQFTPRRGRGVGSTHHYYRMLGDVTGDGLVSSADVNAIAAEFSQSSPRGWTPLGTDADGSGSVTSTDRTIATRANGHKLRSGLPLG
jgi:hypothetical protein